MLRASNIANALRADHARSFRPLVADCVAVEVGVDAGVFGRGAVKAYWFTHQSMARD